MLNPFFTQGTGNEQNLVQQLIDEHIKMHGIEFVYMPRKYGNVKTIMREVTTSEFKKAFPIEGYIENYQGFGDNHNLLTKFGVRSTAEMNVVISQKRYEEAILPLIGDTGIGKPVRPLEGDLIYFPLGDIVFEIKYVEHETPGFYQLNENYTYVLKCEVFEYEDEEINTGIGEIDGDFATIGYNATLTLAGVGTAASAITSLVNGGVNKITIIREGTGFSGDPTIRITSPVNGRVAKAVAITTTNSQGSRSLQEIRITDPGYGYTSVPHLYIETDDGLGGGAQASVGIGTTGAVGIVTVLNGGTEYTQAPSVTFGAPPSGGRIAIGTALLTGDGKVSSIQIIDGGHGYTSAPTVQVSSSSTIGVGTFSYGMPVKGVSTGTTAYATTWNLPTKTLRVKELSGRFAVGEVIIGTATTTGRTIGYTINSVNYDDDDAYEDNQEIQAEAEDILDFTEQNPFGEV